MLSVEQVLSCDICGNEINRLKQTLYPGNALQMLARGPAGVTQWQDVCLDCSGPLSKAFWALKADKTPEKD
jgi:hypothetical protein